MELSVLAFISKISTTADAREFLYVLSAAELVRNASVTDAAGKYVCVRVYTHIAEDCFNQLERSIDRTRHQLNQGTTLAAPHTRCRGWPTSTARWLGLTVGG
jgi:hypothetical protein